MKTLFQFECTFAGNFGKVRTIVFSQSAPQAEMDVLDMIGKNPIADIGKGFVEVLLVAIPIQVIGPEKEP